MKINTSIIKEQVSVKVEEMESLLKELLASDVSENTKRTQKFQRTSQIRQLKVFLAILNQYQDADIALSEEESKWYESMVTLTSERKAKYTIEVHEGDRVMDLMQKYDSVKDVYKKMMRSAEEAGLKADFAKGVFVKA